ncbi:MAG: winged helix DNA-binding domain-containing protein, partial [Chloroflexi bacterium]
ALGELARRYVSAYGPATIADLSAWSGLPIAEARTAVAGAKASLTEVTIQGQPGFVLKDQLQQTATSATPDVRLLPAFDTYLLGYRRRDLAVPRELQARLQRGGGWIHPAVVVNGRAIAAWSLRKSGGRGMVSVEPSGPITRAIRAGIDLEVADIARFLDLSLELEIAR